MLFRRLALSCAALVLAGPLSAATFPLTFNADGSSRWYDFYLDEFAQIDRGFGGNQALDGMYAISAEADPFNPTVYSQVGSDGVDIFPAEGAFASVGSLTYTGTGNGTFPITAIALEIERYVAGDYSALGVGYTTQVSNINGSITIANGAVSGIQMTATIRFIYDASFIPPLTTIPFEGSLEITGNRFAIFVDDDYNFGHGTLHNAWDLVGSVANIGGDLLFRHGFE